MGPVVVDYAVTSLSGSGTTPTGGTAIGETFTIQNQGTDAGAGQVFWTAYMSTDNILDAADTPVDAGMTSALAGGASSAAIDIGSGVWPLVSGATAYWLFVEVTAADDLATGNNTQSAGVTVQPRNVDYAVSVPTANNSPAASGSNRRRGRGGVS